MSAEIDLGSKDMAFSAGSGFAGAHGATQGVEPRQPPLAFLKRRRRRGSGRFHQFARIADQPFQPNCGILVTQRKCVFPFMKVGTCEENPAFVVVSADHWHETG